MVYVCTLLSFSLPRSNINRSSRSSGKYSEDTLYSPCLPAVIYQGNYKGQGSCAHTHHGGCLLLKSVTVHQKEVAWSCIFNNWKYFQHRNRETQLYCTGYPGGIRELSLTKTVCTSTTCDCPILRPVYCVKVTFKAMANILSVDPLMPGVIIVGHVIFEE